jgi:sulfonate transport system substrate-binding protein
LSQRGLPGDVARAVPEKEEITMKNLLLLGVFALVVTVSSTALSAPNKGFVAKIPLSEWTAVASQKGWLQEEFARYGAKVELVDVTAMKIQGVEASLLDKGDLHFAFRMQYSSLQHKLNGLDAVVVWQSGRAPVRRNTIVVLKDSPANSVNDLKGKKLGAWRISCPYFSAFEIFKVKGVPLDTDSKRGEVRNVNISAFAANQAFLAGKVDALTIHPSSYTATPLYTQNLIKEVSASIPSGVYVNGGGRTSVFSTKEFAQEHPELVKAFLVVGEKTKKWILKNPDAAASIISRELRIPKHVAKFGIVDSSSYNYVTGESDWKSAVNSIKLFQDWAVQNGDDFLTKKSLTQAQIEKFVDRRFFKGGQFSIY